MQVNDSVICGYFCNGLIDFILKNKSLLDYANLFSPNKYEKDDKITSKYNSKLKAFLWINSEYSWRKYKSRI